MSYQTLKVATAAIALATVFAVCQPHSGADTRLEIGHPKGGDVTVRLAVARDISRPLGSLTASGEEMNRSEMEQQNSAAPITPPVITSPPGAAAVEQKS